MQQGEPTNVARVRGMEAGGEEGRMFLVFQGASAFLQSPAFPGSAPFMAGGGGAPEGQVLDTGESTWEQELDCPEWWNSGENSPAVSLWECPMPGPGTGH